MRENEEEEVTNSGKESEKPVDHQPEKIEQTEEEKELKVRNEDRKEYVPMDIPAIEGLRAMRKTMEQWAQNMLAMQKYVDDFRQMMNVYDFSPQIKYIRDMRLAMENGTKNVFRTVEQVQEILKAVDWEPILQASKALQEVAKRDEQLQEYTSSPHFWSNLKLISSELISLPLNPTDSLLEEMAKSDMSMDTIRELIETFTDEELHMEIQNEIHGDYMFQTFLLKLLASYKSHPENYQLLIPSQFLILEGTLSETFRVDEKGMAGDIKKRMHLLWDILYALYSHYPINISASLYNQISLTNIKGMFEELTKNSRKSVRINRNGVLHGRSHPDDWLEEDYHLLTQLLYASLYMRRTIDVMLEELTEWSATELLDAIPLEEYREVVIDEVLEKVNKIRKSGQIVSVGDIQLRIKAVVSKELKQILSDDKTVQSLVTLMNIEEIAEDPKFQPK